MKNVKCKMQNGIRFKRMLTPCIALVFFIFLSAFLNPTSQEYKLLNSLPFENVKFTTDNLGNAYVLLENQILQFDSVGKPKGVYAERNAGHLHSVDVSNPLKPLLFYPDFALLQVLDSKLALTSSVYLRNFNIIQPVAACQSTQGGYWVFDLQDYQLKKIDLNLQLKSESGNLMQTLGYAPFPNYMMEWDNNVYMNYPKSGILVFDQYGTYIKTIAITDLKSFQFIGNDLLYVKENKMMKHNLKTLEESEVLLPAHDSLVCARIENPSVGQLYLLTTSSLNFYSY
jgi:hypothetical protein